MVEKESMICPKCQGAMQQGFLIDYAHSQRRVVTWARGAPEQSFWAGVKHTGEIPIGTFRCAECGYLENYARKEFRAQ